MTDEELARFALVLREAELVRARIARDEAAAREEGAGDYPMPVEEQSPAMAAVA